MDGTTILLMPSSSNQLLDNTAQPTATLTTGNTPSTGTPNSLAAPQEILVMGPQEISVTMLP